MECVRAFSRAQSLSREGAPHSPTTQLLQKDVAGTQELTLAGQESGKSEDYMPQQIYQYSLNELSRILKILQKAGIKKQFN